MKRLLILVLTLIMVMVTMSFAKADLPTSLIPAQTKWLIHFDMSQFLSTKISQFLMGAGENDFTEARQKMLKELKLDPFKDLFSVTIFGSGKHKEEAVVCIQGDFSQKFLISRLKEEESYQMVPYGRFNIHKWERRQYGTFVNQKMALLSQSEKNIKNVLDVLAGKGKNVKSGTLFNQVKSIPSGAFLKAATDNLSHLAGDLKEASPLILRNARVALFMAMEKSDILRLKLRLTTKDEKTAKNIYQMVNGLMAMARLHKDNDKELNIVKQMMEAIKISLKKNVLEMEWSQPSDNLIALLKHSKYKTHKKSKKMRSKKR